MSGWLGLAASLAQFSVPFRFFQLLPASSSSSSFLLFWLLAVVGKFGCWGCWVARVFYWSLGPKCQALGEGTVDWRLFRVSLLRIFPFGSVFLVAFMSMVSC